MAEQHGDAVVIADAQEGIRREHIALILGTEGKTVAAGNDKGHHQSPAEHGTALEETTARDSVDVVHDSIPQPSSDARLTAARILGYVPQRQMLPESA
ncbi:hypothetical protein D3C72_1017260 [compost metagenome]